MESRDQFIGTSAAGQVHEDNLIQQPAARGTTVFAQRAFVDNFGNQTTPMQLVELKKQQ